MTLAIQTKQSDKGCDYNFLGTLWDVGRKCQKTVRDIIGHKQRQNFYFRAYEFDARKPIDRTTAIDFSKILNSGTTDVRILIDRELDPNTLYTDDDMYELYVIQVENPNWLTLIPKINAIVGKSKSPAFYLDSCEKCDSETIEIRVTID